MKMREKMTKQIIKKNWIWIIIILLLVSICFVMHLNYESEILNFNLKITDLIYKKMLTQRNINVFKYITSFGSTTWYLILIVCILFFIKPIKNGIYAAGGLGLGACINIIIKNVIRKGRPAFPLIEKSISYSFPSGHAMCATIFYGVILYFIIKESRNKYFKVFSTIFFLILITLISFSRIYLGVHYFTDVIMGIVFGIIVLIIIINTINIIEKKNNLTGLVLEGGGARGSYHVGAIKALNELGIKFDAVVGTSIGSINGAFVAGKQYKEMYKLWNTISCKEIFDIDDKLIIALKTKKINNKILKEGFKQTTKILRNAGIDTKNLKNTLNKHLNEKKLRKSNIDYGLVTYNLTDNLPIKIFKNDIPNNKLVEYIIASSYYPAFKFEKIIDDKIYVDGGVIDRCPIDMLLQKNYKHIYVVKAYQNNLKNIDQNIVTVIKPQKKLGSVILFDQETVKQNIKLGYYDTLKIIEKLDGNTYYFKYKDTKYFISLYSTKNYNKIYRKYNTTIKKKTKKEFIILTLEKVLKEYNINIFKVYNINKIIKKMKKIILKDEKNQYYQFFSSMR